MTFDDANDLAFTGFMLGSVVWIYFDAQKVGTRGLEPAAWALGSLLLWLVFLPLYLVARWRTKRGRFRLNQPT